MEKPKLENKSYKKIVPLRGGLAQKLKKVLEKEKEFPKNGKQTIFVLIFTLLVTLFNLLDNTKTSNCSINNNVDQNIDPVTAQPQESTDKNVIIQKVEKVHIDLIKTPQGPFRRVSSFFQVPQSPKEVQPVIASDSPVNDDEIRVETNASDTVEDKLSTTSRSPIKLLSAKMPANSYNQTVPLKMIRTIRQPKPKPILRKRFHQVQTLKNAASDVKKITSANTEVKFEILVPDIEMGDKLEPSSVPKTIAVACKGFSSSDEEFTGFDPMNQDNEIPKLSLWPEILKDSSLVVSIFETAQPQIKLERITEPLLNTKQTQSKRVTKAGSSKKMQSTPQITAIENVTPNVQCKEIKETQIITPSIKIVAPLSETEVPPNQAIISPQKQNIHVMRINLKESIKKEDELPVKVIRSTKPEVKTAKCYTAPIELKEQQTPTPSTSQQMSLGEPKNELQSWQNDILAVIGSSRIKKIDENLKSIPNLLSDNIYETEIIELKLIVNHLLRILKVDSVLETLKFEEAQSGSEGS